MAEKAVSKRDLKKRELILNGNLLKAVAYIAGPLVLLNLLVFIYGVVDMIVVAGRGSTAVTSVVMVTQIKNLVSTLGSGLSTGGVILVSRFVGANDYDKAKKCANTFLIVSAIVSVTLVSLTIPFTSLILRAAGFDDELLAEGRSYFIVQMITVGVSLVNSPFLGLEKVRGATKNVLFINIAVMAVKILLTVLFVQRFNLGPVWIAASTLFADLIVSGYAIVRLSQKKYLFHFSIKNTLFKKSVLLPYFKLSLPVFVGRFVFNFGKVIVNKLGTKYGSAATGALGVSNNVAGSVTTLTSATEDAYSLIVSQNYGAGNIDRIYKTFSLSVVINVAISLLGTIILYFISDWMITFFATSGSYNGEYAKLIKSIFSLELGGVVFLGLNSAAMGVIYGLGYTKLMLVFNLSRLFVLRLPVILIMLYCFPEMGAVSLGYGMLISNVGVGIVSFVLAIVCLRRLKRNKINRGNNMELLSKKIVNKPERKIKIMQFGEGNFLRAFVEWILQDLNDKGAIDAGVVVVQPMPFGRVKELADQDGLYTLRLEGIDNGKNVKSSRVIDVIGDCVNPFADYEKFLKYGESEDLEVIISNTTEAGIAVDPTDTDFTQCPKSYPGKLLALLKRRYDKFNGDKNKGLAIVPCELIDDNGDELYRCLTELAEINKMDKKFIKWMQTANHFTSTLVDRIVPGYPKNEIEAIQKETGYLDNNVVKGEIFHLWVLKKEKHVQKVLPADQTGLNVIFADDIHPYKQRKVKILNGSHTAMVPVAYLCGIDTVGEAVNDKTIGKYVRDFVFDEVNPTIKLPQDQMVAFANSVLERYQNPYIRHELMSIALNSTTKFKTRILPTLVDYVKIKKALPKHVLFSFAALVEFHKGKRGNEDIALNDDPAYLANWKELWAGFDGCYKCLAEKALGWKEAWDMDMNTIHPEITATVAKYLEAIDTKGMKAAVEEFVNG